MEKKDILESLISYYTDGNKAKFAAKLGIKPQTINTWLGRNSFDVELVYSKCECLSGDWLLSGGEGEMLRETKIVKADNGSIAAGDNSHIHDNTTIGSSTVNNYGDRKEKMEQQEREDVRTSKMFNKMLGMMSAMNTQANEHLSRIKHELEERNKLHSKLLDMLQEKDVQIDKLIDKLIDR